LWADGKLPKCPPTPSAKKRTGGSEEADGEPHTAISEARGGSRIVQSGGVKAEEWVADDARKRGCPTGERKRERQSRGRRVRRRVRSYRFGDEDEVGGIGPGGSEVGIGYGAFRSQFWAVVGRRSGVRATRGVGFVG